ncbi:MAG: acetylornithine aminotransferase [Opitutae bacterium]|nr:acetylornithine aminotransferase [Opitutae bacterium]
MISNDHQKYLVSNYALPALSIVRGQGTKLWDSEGNEYLDFTSGIAVTNLGHNHPEWVRQLNKQSMILTHCSNLFSIPEQVRLAKRLVEKIGPGKVLFCNSGAEANEAMIKLARLSASHGKNGHRNEILVAENGFHGRTMGALSATASSKYRNGFDPLLPGFHFAPFNNLEAFVSLITEKTGAIMLESVQGEGGIHVADDAFLQGLEKICASRNILLLLDEVQAGIGRTGEFLGFQKSGVMPGAVAMAKGLGAGFPIGALWVGKPWENIFTPGTHGTTFGGSPLACSAAHSVLDIMEKENLVQAAKLKGNFLAAKLNELRVKFSNLDLEVRGRGLMLALAMRKEPAPLIKRMRDNGLLVVGAAGNTIRLLPPLNVKQDEIVQAIAIIEKSLKDQ